MSKGTNQKFILYRLAQIMLERTDDDHYITMPEIMTALAEVDEMIVILSDRDAIIQKKEMEHAQALINEIYRNGL